MGCCHVRKIHDLKPMHVATYEGQVQTHKTHPPRLLRSLPSLLSPPHLSGNNKPTMVKLASSRDFRSYGPRLARQRWEYINAGLYMFSTILLSGGFALQLLDDRFAAETGMVVVLVGLVVVIVVNAHDLFAHLAGFDYRFSFMGHDAQLGLVEFAVPVVQIVGCVLVFIGVLMLLIQIVSGYSYRMEKQALNTLLAGPVLWLLGSIHNSCQIYERADGHVQVLQKGVQLPFLMGSLLFLVGSILNRHDIFGTMHYNFKILGKKWVWFSIAGSLLFLVGGLMNVVKVFDMLQMDGHRLEKLRGGAQEMLNRTREGHVPLILENNRRLRREEARSSSPPPPPPVPTPYKDAVVGSSQQA